MIIAFVDTGYSSAVHPSRTTSHRPTRSTSSFRPTRSSSVRPTRTSGIRPTRTSGIRPTRTRGGIHHTRTRFNSGPTPVRNVYHMYSHS